MGRSYAGILGSLAFLIEILRGLGQSGGTESTVTTAVVALVVFAAIGFGIGELAAWIVDSSVRSRLSAEIAAAKPSTSGPKIGPAAPAVTNSAAATVKPAIPPTTAKPTPPKVPAAKPATPAATAATAPSAGAKK